MLQPLLRPLLSPVMRAVAGFAGGFSPAVLYASGQQGAWFAPSEAISTPWYQDSAGTTPVTAVEQPIGKSIDKSGRGNHATQATAAARPVLKQDAGGVYSMLFDGIDDSLSSATGGGGTAGFFWCGAANVTGGAGTNRVLWSDVGADSGYIARVDDLNKLELSAGNGTAFTEVSSVADVAVGSTYVFTVWDDGVNLNVQINSGAIASVARPAVVAGTAGFTIGKNNGGASGFFLGNIYAQVYRKDSGLSAAERENVKRYVANKAGVTL